MKKIQLLVLGLCCIVAVNAQKNYSLKGGLGFAGATAKSGGLTFTADAVIKPQIGVITNLSGTDLFNWQTGVLLNVYGGQYSEDGGTATGSIYTLSVPFFGKYKFTDKFHGYAGPQLSLSVSASTKNKQGNLSATQDINEEIAKPLLFGVFGGGYEVNDKVTAFAEYHFGLNNANKNSSDGTKSKFNLMNFGVIYSLSK
jgi:hypothetical protein